jgi:8-oxo-dGTP pyrophosphatase MutT (NUDIX family)
VLFKPYVNFRLLIKNYNNAYKLLKIFLRMSKDPIEVRITSSVIVPCTPRRDYFWYVKSRKDHLWGLPAGKLHFLGNGKSGYSLEPFYEAAKRESGEELGVPIIVERDPIGIYQFTSSRGHPVVNVTYVGYIKRGFTPRIVRPKEIEAVEKFRLRDIRGLRRTNQLRADGACLQMIRDYLAGKRIPADGFRHLH